MRVKQIADVAGVTLDTVRYYTKVGLLQPTKDAENGYKYYNEQDLTALKFAVRAKQIGFVLSDIHSICDMAREGESPCPKVREIMIENLQRTEKAFREMEQLRNRMREAVKHWDHMEDNCPTGNMICNLIEDWENCPDAKSCE
ncbi:MAG: MerR family transcriptional regulator [Cellvibrionaceae bacterium]